MSFQAANVDAKAVKAFVDAEWDATIVPAISDYIAIPNQSPLYDNDIHTNGYQEAACKLIMDWVADRKCPTLECKLVHDEGKTPLIFMEVPATAGSDAKAGTILMYGHMDKQPPMLPWDEGLGPWTPKIIDGKLYGRGGADDGYAAFAAVNSIMALKAQNIPHARIVVVIEGCEESGSVDLIPYIKKLAPQIGIPNFVICLDSGCGNYDQMWLTSSLRGVMGGNLEVDILSEGVHSGASSGIVPSSFRIMRQLLDRIEDSKTGQLVVPEAFVEIPQMHIDYAGKVGECLGAEVYSNFPWVATENGTSGPTSNDLKELVLNRTWRPTLCITGVDGIPHTSNAGNVLRQRTVLKLSVRIPPTLPPAPIGAKLKEILEANPPYGAKVKFTLDKAGPGWMAPILKPWVQQAGNRASNLFWGKEMMMTGEGGSIPFMGLLGEMWPETQFVITGVLGPKSNAHGPNEFLHIEMGKRVTASVATIVADHYVNTTA